jgi:hypothetical protein
MDGRSCAARPRVQRRSDEEVAPANCPSSTPFDTAAPHGARPGQPFSAVLAEPRLRDPLPELTAFTRVSGLQPRTPVSARERLVTRAADLPRAGWASLGFAFGRVDRPLTLRGLALAPPAARVGRAPSHLRNRGLPERAWAARASGLPGVATGLVPRPSPSQPRRHGGS